MGQRLASAGADTDAATVDFRLKHCKHAFAARSPSRSVESNRRSDACYSANRRAHKLASMTPIVMRDACSELFPLAIGAFWQLWCATAQLAHALHSRARH